MRCIVPAVLELSAQEVIFTIQIAKFSVHSWLPTQNNKPKAASELLYNTNTIVRLQVSYQLIKDTFIFHLRGRYRTSREELSYNLSGPPNSRVGKLPRRQILTSKWTSALIYLDCYPNNLRNALSDSNWKDYEWFCNPAYLVSQHTSQTSGADMKDKKSQPVQVPSRTTMGSRLCTTLTTVIIARVLLYH